MSILTQFLPSINAQIGEIKTVVTKDLNLTPVYANTLIDTDGGVWLRTNNTYKINDYPLLANTIGFANSYHFKYNGAGFTVEAGGQIKSVGTVAYSTAGGGDDRLVTAFNGGGNSWVVSMNGTPDGVFSVAIDSQSGGQWVYTMAYSGGNSTYVGQPFTYIAAGNVISRGYIGNTTYGGIGTVGWTDVVGTAAVSANGGVCYSSAFGFGNTFVVRSSNGYGWFSRDYGYATWLPIRDATGNTFQDPLNRDAQATYAMAYGANNFVAISATAGIPSLSYDGNTWTGMGGAVNGSGYLYNIIYANNQFIAVGDGDGWPGGDANANTILAVSANGVTWTRKPISLKTNVRAIAYGNGAYVAGGDGGYVAFSTEANANTWANAACTNTVAYISAIAYGSVNNIPTFVYAANTTGSALALSIDNGNNWTLSTNNGYQAPAFRDYTSIAFGSNTFVAGNSTGNVSVSADGNTWFNYFTGSRQITGMSFANGVFILGDSDGIIRHCSPQNINVANGWSGLPTAQNTMGVTYFNNTYVVIANTQIYTSPNANVWFRTIDGKGRSGFTYKGIANSSNLAVVVGDFGYIRTSPNGNIWSTLANTGTGGIQYGLAYGNGIYVSGGASGNLATSTDGVHWASINATTSQINAVYYANGLFLYGTSGGGVASSTDGVNWTGASNTTQTMYGAAYGNNAYVIVGGAGIILRSANGQYWANQVSTSTSQWNAVNYGNNLFMAVGTSGNIATSTDGNTWVKRFAATANSLYAVGYGGTSSLYVYAGASGNLATSTDANTWTSRTSNTTSQINAIAANGSNLFVYGAAGGNIASSTDGITWFPRTSGQTQTYYAALFANGVFLIGGGSGNLISSTDGTTWTARTSNTSSQINALGYDSKNRIYFYAGVNGAYGTSTDGTTWYANTSETTTTIQAVAYGAGNANTAVYTGVGGIIRFSANTVKWSGAANGNDIYAFTFGNGQYVMIGNGIARTSPDGIYWTTRTTATANAYYVAAYGANLYVAGGASGNMSSSTDGITWTAIASPNAGSNAIYSLIYANNIFMYGAAGSNVATSTDAVTWTPRSSGLPNTGYQIRGIAFTSNANTFMYVGTAVGTSIATATSVDSGVNWTLKYPTSNLSAPSCYAIVYGNNEFVTVGTTAVQYGPATPLKSSNNGNTWSGTKTNANLTSVTFGNNLFVAVGANGTVLTSGNGITWNVTNANITSRFVTGPFGPANTLNAVALNFATYTNNLFFIGGEEGLFRYSSDGVTWSGGNVVRWALINSLTYGQNKYVVCGNAGYIATSTDLNTWSEQRSGITNNLTSVLYNPTSNSFIVAGANGVIRTSTDAVNWLSSNSKVSASEHIQQLFLDRSNSNNTIFVGGKGRFGTSNNGGNSWSGFGLTGFLDVYGQYFTNYTNFSAGNDQRAANANCTISYDSNTRLYCVSNGISFATSTDLYTWNLAVHRYPRSTRGANSLIRVWGMAYGGTSNLTVAAGGQSMTHIRSQDGGNNWTSLNFEAEAGSAAGGLIGSGPFIRDMTFANNQFIAVGDFGKMYTSANGAYWTSIANTVTGANANLYFITFNQGTWMTGGDANNLFISPDLTNWIRMSVNYAGNTITGNFRTGLMSANGGMLTDSVGGVYYVNSSNVSRGVSDLYNTATDFLVPNVTLTTPVVTRPSAAANANGISFPTTATYMKAK
jgi:hypothetical protein